MRRLTIFVVVAVGTLMGSVAALFMAEALAPSAPVAAVAEAQTPEDAALRAVVGIWRQEISEQTGQGLDAPEWGASGVVVKDREDGMLVLTAGHVVRACAGGLIKVGRFDGVGSFHELVAAVVVWAPDDKDIAALLVPGEHGWPTVRLAHAIGLRGQECINIGTVPIGTAVLTRGETQGLVPGVARWTKPVGMSPIYEGCYLVTAHAYFGFSGGPCLVKNGGQWCLIGVVVAGTPYGNGPVQWQTWVWPAWDVPLEVFGE